MKERFLKGQSDASCTKMYLVTFLTIFLGCIIITNREVNTDLIHSLMYLCILSATLMIAAKSISNGVSEENILFLIIFIGCVLRIGYTYYNGPFSRTHDIGAYDDLNGNSKATYLMWILERGKLPDSYSGQLYHQPFSYFMSALSCKLIKPFLLNTDIYFVASIGGKLSSCLASCGVLFMTPRLGKHIFKNLKSILFLTWLVAVFPGFLYVAGRLGEDAFCCFFMLAEILYSIKWSTQKDIKSTVILAIIYGLGLQTSITCVLPLAFTIYLVASELWKEKDLWKKYLHLTGVFLTIMLPCGLWFYIRNLIKFKIPFTYVNKQIVEGPNWTGDVALWKRYLPLDIVNVIKNPFTLPYDDYNLPTYFLKSELFGEYTLEINRLLPYVMLFISIMIAIVSLVTVFLALFRKQSTILVRALAGLVTFFCIFDAYSYLKEPFGCSMDARYFLIITILKIVFFAYFYDEFIANKDLPICNNVTKYMVLATTLFGACSIIMFCYIR